MARFNPKSFAQPDLLKAIQPEILLRVLAPCREVLEQRGFSWPAESTDELDYLRLGSILAEPDEWIGAEVIEGLHLISSLGTDDHFDQLFDVARKNFVDFPLDCTAEDLAARIWLCAPDLLVLKDRAGGAERRRKFESYRARDPKIVFQPGDLPTDLGDLEAALEQWFSARRRGDGCRVVRADTPNEVRFFVQHGDLCKREPSRQGVKSSTVYYRPEKTDLVVCDLIQNELRVNARSLGEHRLYVAEFGRHLFGDPEAFVYRQKYTLRPLLHDGPAALKCLDVGGLEWASLVELEFEMSGTVGSSWRVKAHDVFQTLADENYRLQSRHRLVHARFLVKIQGEGTPRPLLVRPPGVAEYARGEESAILERWLLKRGFILMGTEEEDEDTHPLLAVA